MKKNIIYITALFISSFGFMQFSHAQGAEEVKGMKQTLDMTIDNLGNAVVEASQKLNAQQWDIMKREIGSNTSIFKNAMQKALPKYYLTDFDYTEQPMERTYKLKFKVLGICYINKDGKWQSDLESKDPDITKLSDREFMTTADMMSGGVFIQQTQKLHLPSGVKDAKIEKDSFGKAILTYSTNTGGTNYLMYLGILVVLAGGWMFYKNSQSAVSTAQKPVPPPVA